MPQTFVKQSNSLNTLSNAPISDKPKVKLNQKTKDLKKKPKDQAKKFMRMWFDQYFKMVTAVVCVILFVVSYIFFLHPQISRAMDLRGKDYQNSLNKQQKLQDQLDYLVRAQTDRTKISKKEIENIDLLLPSSHLTPQIFTSLEAIAESSNASIESIDIVILDPKHVADLNDKLDAKFNLPPEVWVVEIGVSILSGPYDDLKSFLSNLEKNIRLMDVVAVTYNPTGKSYNLTIRSYYLPDTLQKN